MHPFDSASALTPNTPSSGLLQGIKSRDDDAWERLVRVYGPAIYIQAKRAGLQPIDAEELVLDVFVAVNRKAESFHRDPGGSGFCSWLYTITKNKILDYYSKQKKRPVVTRLVDALGFRRNLENPEEDISDGPANQSLLHLTQMCAIDSIKDEFTGDTWDAFIRTYVDGVPATEVADEMGISANAVRHRKCRVSARLREVFGDLFEG